MTRLTFWYDFASNYAYLSAMRIEKLCEHANVQLVWRPFLLGPIFKKNGWNTSPFNIYAQKGKYMKRDMERRSDKYNLGPFKLPDEFPQNSIHAARIGTFGANSDWIGAYTKAVFESQFVHGMSIADKKTHVGLLSDLDLPGDEIVDRVHSDQAIKDELRTVTDTAMTSGIFGAPSFTIDDGELFWGDDRLEDAIEWARGLQKLNHAG